jgi:peptidoglycan/xylan/chitin deacetylase (PgdA/CDA1 family)
LDRENATSSATRPRSLADLARAALGADVEPRHRRRRLVALLAVAGVSLLIGVIVGGGAGGSAKRHPEAARTGFFGRIQLLAGTGTGSFAADEQTAEDNAIEHTMSYTPYVRVAGSQHRELALTFDDGPGPFTTQVVSVLTRMHVPATFFEIGVSEQYFHAGTSAIVAAGDPIGDHTMAHAPMSKLSPRDQQTQLLQETAAIGRYGAPFPRLFRPPYGLWDNATLKLLRKYHMLMILWTVDTNDYRRPGIDSIISTAVSGARPGAIILMHDAGGDRSETVAALPTIINKLRAKGYTLVTVPRLLLDNPAPANQSYSNGAFSGG